MAGGVEMGVDGWMEETGWPDREGRVVGWTEEAKIDC